jgi:nucleoid DNA-binding protein
MAKMMSKSQLIQKIVEQHSNTLTRKGVKVVIEALASIGYKELNRSLCQIRGDQKASNQGARGH